MGGGICTQAPCFPLGVWLVGLFCFSQSDFAPGKLQCLAPGPGLLTRGRVTTEPSSSVPAAWFPAPHGASFLNNETQEKHIAAPNRYSSLRWTPGHQPGPARAGLLLFITRRSPWAPLSSQGFHPQHSEHQLCSMSTAQESKALKKTLPPLISLSY